MSGGDQHDTVRRGAAVRERTIVAGGGINADSGGHSHWGGIVASVVIGLGLTLLLVLIGSAAGLVAGSDENDADAVKGITAALGAWTILSMIVATFIGSFAGGRMSRWLTRGTALYHALASWGLAVLVGATVLAIMSMGLLGTATTAASNVAGGAAGNERATAQAQEAADGDAASDAEAEDASATATDAAQDAASGLGKASWALALGLLATLAASIAGWLLGSRKPLLGFERGDTSRDVRAS